MQCDRKLAQGMTRYVCGLFKLGICKQIMQLSVCLFSTTARVITTKTGRDFALEIPCINPLVGKQTTNSEMTNHPLSFTCQDQSLDWLSNIFRPISLACEGFECVESMNHSAIPILNKLLAVFLFCDRCCNTAECSAAVAPATINLIFQHKHQQKCAALKRLESHVIHR